MVEKAQNSAVDNKEKSAAEETVTMIFPKDVIVNDGGVHITFKAGPNEVPASLADNWYLKANGVTRYEKNVAKVEAKKK